MREPVFFKELPLILQVGGKPELAGFSVGVSKAIDPESGMMVNLSELVSWQNEWKQAASALSFSSWFEFLEQSLVFFENRCGQLQAHCRVVQIRFFDRSLVRLQNRVFSFSKAYQSADSTGRLQVLNLEVPLESESDLLRARQFQFPDPFPGSWDEQSLLISYSQSHFGFPARRIEIWDPLREEALVL